MIDLHTHSTFSDGTVTPTQLVLLAEQAGLTAVALCDHNTVDGLPEFLAAGIARELNLLESGGSDFHGERKPDVSLGSGRGDLSVPDHFLTQLRKRAE